MKIDINNIGEDIIKNLQDGRIKAMPMINHGDRLDAKSMMSMLEAAKNVGPLINLDDLFEEEWKNNAWPWRNWV